MTVKTSTLKALILSTTLVAALPLVGCAGSANEPDDAEASAESDGDEHVASTSSAFSVVTSSYYDLGTYGGSGGTSATTLRCPTGNVLVGLHGRSGNVIDQVGLICAPLNASGTLGNRITTAARGGYGGTPFHLECGANEAVIGFGISWGSYVDGFRLKCSKAPFTTVQRETDWVGGVGFGGYANPVCPDNDVITQIAVRTGNVVDAMRPRCTYVGTH